MRRAPQKLVQVRAYVLFQVLESHLSPLLLLLSPKDLIIENISLLQLPTPWIKLYILHCNLYFPFLHSLLLCTVGRKQCQDTIFLGDCLVHKERRATCWQNLKRLHVQNAIKAKCISPPQASLVKKAAWIFPLKTIPHCCFKARGR